MSGLLLQRSLRDISATDSIDITEMSLAIDPIDVIEETFVLGDLVEEHGDVGLTGLWGSFGGAFFGCLDN